MADTKGAQWAAIRQDKKQYDQLSDMNKYKFWKYGYDKGYELKVKKTSASQSEIDKYIPKPEQQNYAMKKMTQQTEEFKQYENIPSQIAQRNEHNAIATKIEQDEIRKKVAGSVAFKQPSAVKLGQPSVMPSLLGKTPLKTPDQIVKSTQEGKPNKRIQEVLLGIGPKPTPEERKQANDFALKTKQGTFASAFWKGVPFGGSADIYKDNKEAIAEGQAKFPKSATKGAIVGGLTGQGLTYAIASPVIGATKLGKAALGLGKGAIGAFAGKQALELGIDVAIQTPQEVVKAINNGSTFGEFAKSWGENMALSVLFNGAVGGGAEAVKTLKNTLSSADALKSMSNLGIDQKVVTDAFKALESGNPKPLQQLSDNVQRGVKPRADVPDLQVPGKRPIYVNTQGTASKSLASAEMPIDIPSGRLALEAPIPVKNVELTASKPFIDNQGNKKTFQGWETDEKLTLDMAHSGVLGDDGKFYRVKDGEHHTELLERMWDSGKTDVNPENTSGKIYEIMGFKYGDTFINLKDLDAAKGDLKTAILSKVKAEPSQTKIVPDEPFDFSAKVTREVPRTVTPDQLAENRLRELGNRVRSGEVSQAEGEVIARRLVEEAQTARTQASAMPVDESPSLNVELPSKPKTDMTPQEKVQALQTEDGKGFRQAISNSFAKSEMPQEAKQVFEDNPLLYDKISNKETWDNAYANVSKDFESAVNRFKGKDSLENADDTAEAIAIMHKLANDKDIDGLINVASDFAERGTKAGQAVQAIVMLQRSTPEGKLIQGYNIVDNIKKQLKEEMPDLYNKLKSEGKLPEITREEAEFIVNTMEGAKNLEGRLKDIEIAKVDQLLSNKIPITFADKLRALRNLSLLGNFKTLVARNPLGNVIFSGLENIAQIPSGITDKMVSAILKTPRQTAVFPNLLAQGKGLGKGISEAASDVKLNIDTSPTRGGIELPRSRKVFELSWLNKANNWLGDALKFGDRPFYQAAYEGRLAELKKLQPNADVKELERISKEFGMERVFQNNGETSKAVAKFKSALNTANIKGFGVGDIAMPYTQTPANILAKGVQYTPLGIINVAKQLGGGGIKQNQKAFTDAVGRLFTGTGIAALGYALARDGMITGKPTSKSDKVKDLKASSGEQNYSIKIGDKFYSYDWAQPASIPLAVGVDFYNAGASEEDFLSALIAGTTSGGDTLFKQGVMQGITRMFGGTSPTESVAGVVSMLPSQFVPTLGSQTAQMKDPYKREIDYSSIPSQLKTTIAKKIPGVRETLPTVLDIWGQPMKEQQGRQGLSRAIDVFLNPSLKTEITKDPTTKELMRLYQSTKDTDIIPSYVPGKLADTESKRAFKILYGQLAKAKVESAINSFSYKNATDVEKAELLSKVLSAVQRESKDKYNKQYKTDLK